MKKIFSIAILVISTFIFVGCGDDEVSTNSKYTMPKEGSSVTLDEEAVVLTSKKNVEKFIDFLQEKNTTARDKMFTDGEARTIKKGEKVDIIDSGTVVELKYVDKTYYAVYEAIQ